MDDPLFRLALVVLVAAAALGVAALLGRRPRGIPLRVAGLAPGVVLFAAEGCDSCAAAEQVIERTVGHRYTRLLREQSPHAFARAGVTEVPVVAVVGDEGLVWSARGVPSAPRLRKAVRRVPTVG